MKVAARQASLDGFDPPGPPTDRLFFALFPAPADAARISIAARQLREAHGLRGQPLKTERFHVTLHHLGDFAGFPPGLVDKAIQAAGQVTAQPVELRFDRAMSFVPKGRRHDRPFVLLADPALQGVWRLHAALCQALTRAGLGRQVGKDFVPHVTLLYDDQAVPEQPVQPLSWQAGEFVLVHSLLGKTQHIPLGRWTLEGGEA